MKSISIRLDGPESVKQFVNVTSQFDYEMILKGGKYAVDPKSLLGIFSLDLSSPLVLEVVSDECDDLITALGAFIG